MRKRAMSTWEGLLVLLYSVPTQEAWDSNKKIALEFLTDPIREEISSAIDAIGCYFLEIQTATLN